MVMPFLVSFLVSSVSQYSRKNSLPNPFCCLDYLELQLMFGALASAEEEVVEEEVDITFLPPKPKKKEKAKETKKKVAVKAAADAIEGGSR